MTLPAPRLHPDPAPDTGGDWSLYLWLPIVLAAAGVRWLRWHLCGAAYRLGDALNDAPPLDPERQDVVGQRIMGGVEADAVRGRGGAT